MTNDHLKVLTAAMNAAAKLPSKAGLEKEPIFLKDYFHYVNEMAGFDFSVHDNTKETNQMMSNTRKQMNGRTAKYFLHGIFSVLCEMANTDPSDWTHEYNTGQFISLGPHTSSMATEIMRRIANDFVNSSIIVAESPGTKNTILEDKPSTVIDFGKQKTIDLWIQKSVSQCHNQFKTMFTDWQTTPYPDYSWHRLDYAVQVHPLSLEYALVPDLSEAQKVSRLALRTTKPDQEEYYNRIDDLSQYGKMKIQFSHTCPPLRSTTHTHHLLSLCNLYYSRYSLYHQ